MAHVILDKKGNVHGMFAMAQDRVPGYAEIPDADPRIKKFQKWVEEGAVWPPPGVSDETLPDEYKSIPVVVPAKPKTARKKSK